MILDEAQHAPELFSYVQVMVDERPDRGRFILSGSHNFLLMRRIAQSLAGRVHISHLLPFSPAELHDLPLRSVEDICDPPDNATPGEWTEVALTGGYPPIHDRRLDPSEWLRPRRGLGAVSSNVGSLSLRRAATLANLPNTQTDDPSKEAT